MCIRDRYLAAASHDLLQPLNAARLLISTLRERELPSAEHNLVERSHLALEGAEDLLADLLDISKLDQAAIKPDVDVYRLEELLAPLASEFDSVASSSGLRLRAVSYTHLDVYKRQGHLCQSGPGGMIELLDGLPTARKILIHINNTNPILDLDSPERAELDAHGIEVAFDGMSIVL